ncbi:unnamed protein product [Closterium sp. NIES-53]
MLNRLNSHLLPRPSTRRLSSTSRLPSRAQLPASPSSEVYFEAPQNTSLHSSSIVNFPPSLKSPTPRFTSATSPPPTFPNRSLPPPPSPPSLFSTPLHPPPFPPSLFSTSPPFPPLPQVFLCYGRFIFGPDFCSLVISFLLILIPGILFCVFVAAQLPGKIPGGIVVLPVAICYLAWVRGGMGDIQVSLPRFNLPLYPSPPRSSSPCLPPPLQNLFILVFTACRDPGIVPRNLVPPDPDPDMLEAMRVEGGGLATGGRVSLPRTKDVEINGFRVKVKYCDTCLLYSLLLPPPPPPRSLPASPHVSDPPAARTAACAITVWSGKVREEREGQCIGKVREEREGQCIGKKVDFRDVSKTPQRCSAFSFPALLPTPPPPPHTPPFPPYQRNYCEALCPHSPSPLIPFLPTPPPPHTPPFSPYQRNYRFFYMFTTTTTLLCLFVFAISTLLIALLVNNTYEPGGKPRTLWEAMGKAPVAVILMVYTFIVVWFVGGLTAFHTFLSATNQVSIVC